MSNEGKALVLVPLDAVPPPGETAGDALGDAPASPLAHRLAKHPAIHQEDRVMHHLAHIADLERRIGDLRAALDISRQDVERERAERQGERERADKVTSEMAEIARQFATITATTTAEARAREMVLEARLDAARSEMASLRGRPWWARLMISRN